MKKLDRKPDTTTKCGGIVLSLPLDLGQPEKGVGWQESSLCPPKKLASSLYNAVEGDHLMSVAKSRRPAADITKLPAQEISTEVLVEKYAKDGETTIREVRARVAKALAANENDEK